MDPLLRTILLVALPTAGVLIAGLLAEWIDLSKRALSLLLHAVAGMLLGVVGVELMPQVMGGSNDLLMVLLFVAGGLLLVGINAGTKIIQNMKSTGGSGAAGWAILLGVGIDIVTDGLTISTGATLSQGTGLLLAIALLMVDAPEAFTTISTLKSQKSPRRMRILATLIMPALLFLGGLGSYFILRGQPEVVRLGVLAFTAGEIVALVVSQIVVEAHRKWEGSLATVLLVLGFGLFAFLSAVMQGGGEEGNGAPNPSNREADAKPTLQVVDRTSIEQTDFRPYWIAYK